MTKPSKGKGMIILEGRLYNNAIPEIISDTSKFLNIDKGLILKREAFYMSGRRKIF